MNYQPIPSYLKEYADALTLLRVEINRKRYKGTHKQRTGTKNSKLLGEVERHPLLLREQEALKTIVILSL